MSKELGMAALNLEMPDRVPRTEYSAHMHWELVERVTGLAAEPGDPEPVRQRASSAFVKAWDYSYFWNLWVGSWNGVFDDFYTRMGHAEFASEGADFDSLVSCPFSEPEEVLDFDPVRQYGVRDRSKLIADFNADFRHMEACYPDNINSTGIYTSCVSGLIDIFGWDMLLMAAGTDLEKFGDVTRRYGDYIQQYFDALADSEAEVVMIHDDIVWTAGAFLHPDFYRKFIFPNYKRHLRPLIDAGKKILFTSDGNYTEFIDDIAACGVNGFVMEPMTDMKYIAEKYGKTHAFIGNADTRILLSGTKADIEAEVRRCMDIGKSCPGFFMAVGNHIPSNTPVENALRYNEIVEKMARR